MISILLFAVELSTIIASNCSLLCAFDFSVAATVCGAARTLRKPAEDDRRKEVRRPRPRFKSVRCCLFGFFRSHTSSSFAPDTATVAHIGSAAERANEDDVARATQAAAVSSPRCAKLFALVCTHTVAVAVASSFPANLCTNLFSFDSKALRTTSNLQRAVTILIT